MTQATNENIKWRTTYSLLVLQTPSTFYTDMKVFEDFVSVLQVILLTKIKILDVGTGAQQQWQGVY